MTHPDTETQWWMVEPPEYEFEPAANVDLQGDDCSEQEWLQSKNEAIILTETPAAAFEKLGAKEWIESVRVATDSGAIDFAGTAERAGVDVVWSPTTPFAGQIHLECADRPQMHISIGGSMTDEYAVTFGHELGHLFVRQVLGLTLDRNEDSDFLGSEHAIEETFCTYFGVQMAFPAEQVSKYDSVDGALVADISKTHQLTVLQVIQQFMRQNKLPRHVGFVAWFMQARERSPLATLPQYDTTCIDCEEENDGHQHSSDDETPFIGIVSAPEKIDSCLSILDTEADVTKVAAAISLCLKHEIWSPADERLFRESTAISEEDRLVVNAKLMEHEHETGNQPELF